MKNLLIVLLLLPHFIHAQDKDGLATVKDLDPKENLLKPYEGKLEEIKRNFQVGDLNGDHKKDSVYVSYKRVISPDSTYQKACGQNVCYARIEFSSKIPEMIVESYSIDIRGIGDVNHDGKDDLLVFLEFEMYNWGQIRVYSYAGKKWTLLQSVNAFLSDDTDYENRITKSGKNYYLVEDVWNKDYTRVFRRQLKINPKSKPKS